jgi:hypothetical protein
MKKKVKVIDIENPDVVHELTLDTKRNQILEWRKKHLVKKT